ncbi:ATP-binding protein [Streptomyces sp. NPDC087226]|uniref:ATP-binding protein n=1 Tax=Streptomyces sp. NPDC087226 TaxID=3365771 RepID=UPI0038297795
MLQLDAAGGLMSAHVRAGARLAGVHSRTVWRWVEAARSEGRVERRRRSRFELSREAWEVLAQAGGNVSVLYRHLKDCGDGDAGVSLASVYRAVQRELPGGRVLPGRAVLRQERVERETRQALVDLVVAGAGGPSVSELRRAVFEALPLAGRFPHRSAEADERIIGALGQARVLVVDEAQRLPVPCLEYLQSLWDHPQARIALVLCGAGSERAVARVPQLASRICAWQEVRRLAAARWLRRCRPFIPCGPA